MVFFKNVEVRCMRDKYGGTQRGLFALERIKKGEKIWFCDCTDKDGAFTRKQLLNIIKKHPKLDYFVRSFSYMIDDDLYAMPLTYMEEKNNDECALFNHSCNPNCGLGFGDDDEEGFGDNVICIRDIDIGEELTYHYGLLETEASLINGLKCECNSPNCCGLLTFDFYRDAAFVEKFFPYMTPYLREKVRDMKNRWFSTNCYVKRLPPSNDATSVSSSSSSLSSLPTSANDSSSGDSSDDSKPNDVEHWQKSLFSLNSLKKGDLVARFSDEIHPSSHFIRHSSVPNCVLLDADVYTLTDIPEDSELTIYYHGILL
jgi:hypothetical protein